MGNQTRSAPTVSVVMAVYNSARTVQSAIDSILHQSFGDFEFIIVDDGSSDDTPTILRACPDPRVILLRNEQNIGLTRSLNKGLEVARGEYIARMDADDISLPHRLEKQVQYMSGHPEVDVLGTNIRFIDDADELLEGGQPLYTEALSPGLTKWLLLWMNPIPHPTVMMRGAVLQERGLRYNPVFETSQDYALWCQMARFASLTVLGDICLHYRLSTTSVTRKRSTHQPTDYYTAIRSVMQEQIANLLGKPISTRQMDALLKLLVTGVDISESSDFVGAAEIVTKAYQRFLEYPLSRDERRSIRAHAIERIRSIRDRAAQFSRGKAFLVLWQLRRISLSVFLSEALSK